MIVVLFALALTGLCFLICYGLIRSLVKPRQELNRRLRSLEAPEEAEASAMGGSHARMPREKQAFRDRVLIPLRNTLGQWLTDLAPAGWAKLLEHKLVLAGKAKSWTVQGFALVWAAFLLLGILVGIRYVSNRPDLAVVQGGAMLVVFTAFAGGIPFLMLRATIQKRQALLLKQMPEVLDLLCVSVQAGLTFDAAMRRIISHMQGPLIDEFQRMLDDVRMGLPRRQAIRMLADRCEVSDLTLFCTSLIQAEQLGTSITTTLINQADNMRDRHRQRVKAKAMRAPIKMLFPLMVCIFPTIFMLALLPPILGIMNSFLNK